MTRPHVSTWRCYGRRHWAFVGWPVSVILLHVTDAEARGLSLDDTPGWRRIAPRWRLWIGRPGVLGTVVGRR